MFVSHVESTNSDHTIPNEFQKGSINFKFVRIIVYLRVPFKSTEFSVRSPGENRKSSSSRLMVTAMMRLLE